MDYDFKKEVNGVIITIYGVITGEELRSLNFTIMADLDFQIWRYKIWDFSNAEKIDLSLDDIRSFIFQDSMAAAGNPNVKIAIIPGQHKRSGTDDIFHLLSKQLDGYESKSFKNIKSAKKWIAQKIDH